MKPTTIGTSALLVGHNSIAGMVPVDLIDVLVAASTELLIDHSNLYTKRTSLATVSYCQQLKVLLALSVDSIEQQNSSTVHHELV